MERAAAPRPGVQAVDFKGRTHRTVLERMGIWDEVHRQRTGTTDFVFVDEKDRRRATLPGEFTGGDVEIQRGDLAEILYRHTADTCTYVFGDTIADLSEASDGVRVTFEHGAPQTFDLVIGADGVHSRVRHLAFGPEREHVKHLGYYNCVAAASPWGDEQNRDRLTAYGFNAPGRLAMSGGPKAQQFYLFASDEFAYARRCGRAATYRPGRLRGTGLGDPPHADAATPSSAGRRIPGGSWPRGPRRASGCATGS
ncbi:FAD-dependent monooxygenase [Nocardia puris]|uniref:FAD-dependent monooxygenase n=1 Tax=Nocardia puris TaxID=208602 RepID=UPI002B4AB874|nr:FAD-dependent monooxygenase [Nocardia puris]